MAVSLPPEPPEIVAEVAAGDDLTRQALHGLKWTYAGTVIGLVLQLAYTVVMARLLTDAAFGLVTSANVVLRFGQYFAELGLGPALVQKRELSRDEIRAAFTSSLLLGGVLAAGLAASAPALRAVFDTPEVVPVFRVLALSLLLNGLALVSMSLLRRNLRFREAALVEVGSFAIGYLGVGLTTALLGAGVYSLVAAALCQLTLMAIAAYWLVRHPLAPLVAWRRLRPLYSFGGRVSVITLLEYVSGAVVALVIGRYSGPAALGQYSRAATLIELPLVHLTSSLSKVLFPALARVQGDRQRVKEAYLSAVRVSAAVLLPVAAGAAVAAPVMVRVVLGPQWDQAALVLPVLAGAAALALLSHYGGIVCEALAVLRAKMILQASFLVGIIAGLIAVPSGELLGYALVLLAAELVRGSVYAVLMARTLAIGNREQLVTYGPALLAAGVVAAAIAGWTTLGDSAGVPLGVVFAGLVLLGAASLLLCVRYGPLRGVGRDIVRRFTGAGLVADSQVVRLLTRVLVPAKP